MLRSAGFRFMIVGVLVLLMFIPMFFVGSIIDSRANYSRSTIETVSDEWGGRQLISGPVLVIPVTEQVTTRKRRDVIDPATGLVKRDEKSGEVLYEYYEDTTTEPRAPIYLFPRNFGFTAATTTEERHRGIFKVPVYRAEAVIEFDFDTDDTAKVLGTKEKVNWNGATLRLSLTANKALRGKAELTGGGVALVLEPISSEAGDAQGIFARTGDPRKIGKFRWKLGFNGAQALSVAPVGRDSRVSFSSDWPHPSFFGAFLPNESEITDSGFTARWDIPHLARALPQAARENHDFAARARTAFGVRFYQPNDFYQKAYRAARYGILFIALTFLTVLLLDRVGEKPAHPVQYILIGLAQSVFVLLMVAYAEQIGFGPAYLLASGATIGALVMFGALGLKLGRRTLVLGLMLVVLYGVLYLVLQSADYALLAGATLAFAALVGTMYLTRNEDWYGEPRPPRKRRDRRAPEPAPETIEIAKPEAPDNDQIA